VIEVRFEFSTSSRILFGPGTFEDVPDVARTLGRRVFILYDLFELANPLIEQLKVKGLAPLPYPIQGEPTVQSVLEAISTAREETCDLVISIGGGSTLDTGKAVAALLANPGNLLDYMEVIGTGKVLENPSAPYIAIPTTAGTGSEVTCNAVIAVPEERVKVSIRSPYLLPRLAVVDPELTYSLPPEITAATGLDALTQCIEPFVCNSPNPITDAVCREGIKRVVRSLQQAFLDGKDARAREDMSLASLFGGISLANARLGAVHGFAGPLGGMLHAPHGVLCARLLPFVMEVNIYALRKRDPGSPVLERFTEIATLLTKNALAKAEDGTCWLKRLVLSLNIPPLATYGLTKSLFPSTIVQARKASSMKGNPIELKDEELNKILENTI
jgi:alcohol dehydrogenase class IV